jgi:hypothetical protein
MHESLEELMSGLDGKSRLKETLERIWDGNNETNIRETKPDRVAAD